MFIFCSVFYIIYYNYIADAFFNLQDYENSKLVYSKINILDSSNVNVYIKLGEIALQEKNPKEAINLFLYATKKNPNDIEFNIKRGKGKTTIGIKIIPLIMVIYLLWAYFSNEMWHF